MAIEKVKKKSNNKVKDFKFFKEDPVSTVTNTRLSEQKASLLKYNEGIRTAKSIALTDNGRLKIPVFTSNPAVCEVGEIALIGGIMKYCSSTNTWSNI